jgi:hypothetical protein
MTSVNKICIANFGLKLCDFLTALLLTVVNFIYHKILSKNILRVTAECRNSLIKMESTVFWDVTSCSATEDEWRSGGEKYSFNLQSEKK